MADLLSKASAMLARSVRGSLGRRVLYRTSDGAAEVVVSAAVGSSVFEGTDGQGGSVAFQSRDYLIVSADLVLQGVRYEPAAGDRIIELDSGTDTARHYEVLSMIGEPCWRWSDPARTVRRIHTKEVVS